MRRRPLPDIEGVIVERGVGPSRETAPAVTTPQPREAELAPRHSGSSKQPDLAASIDTLPDALAAALPEQRPPQTDEPTLTADEREAFTRCLQVLSVVDSFWVQGLALETVALGELHREDYETFDAFTSSVWGKSARRAYQLIEVAPLGQYLWTEVRKIFHTATINEAQARALLPLAKAHGPQAAALVMTTLLQAGEKVTASLLRGVLAVLPKDRFDEEEAVRLIKEYLAGPRVLPSPQRSADPDDIFVAETRRLDTITRRIITHAKDDPGAARAFAEKLDQMAARIRAELGE